MAWEPYRRSNFFFSPPAHLCAVICMTEILLIVTLNNQFTLPLNVPVLHWHRTTLLYGYSEKPPHLVAFYDTHGINDIHFESYLYNPRQMRFEINGLFSTL